jgi:sterol desaturase/sphingolipid hydroxylase (fatty acid hydroxylase superfamily)
LNIGLLFLILIVEGLFVFCIISSFRLFGHPDKSSINDICIFFFNALQIDYILMFLVTAGILHKQKLGVKAVVGLNEGLLASYVSSPVLQLTIYILVADFMIYLAHLLHHKINFFWAFHSYHHSATELNVLTANRGHPVQSELTNGLITFIPLTLLGFPLISFMVFKVLRTTLTYMHHSRLTWKWGWFGHYILVSPAFHRVHHSVLPEHHDKNLAVLFPVWDHIFGTYYKGSTPAIEMGLPDNPYNQKDFLYDLTVPFRMLRPIFRRSEVDEND